jgi:4-amino-4-deoxy-L-arabinose transferase-like glycosyltransferase
MEEPQALESAAPTPRSAVSRRAVLGVVALAAVICAALAQHQSVPSDIPIWVVLVSVAAIVGGAVAFPNPLAPAALPGTLPLLGSRQLIPGTLVLVASALAACAIWSREPFARMQEFVNPQSTYAAALWVAGMLLGLALLWPAAGGRTPDEARAAYGRRSWWIVVELFALLVILDVAAGLRLWHLASIPEGIWFDEADFANAAQRLYTLPFQPFGPGNIGHNPSLYFYVEAIALNWLGTSMAAVRLSSSFFGLIAVLAAYLLGRKAGGPGLGLIAAAFLAMNQWAIDFSRFGMSNIAAPAMTGLGLLALVQSMRRPIGFWFALSGVVLGLSVLTYAGGFLASALVALGVVAIRLCFSPRFRRVAWPGALLLPLGMAVGGAPFLISLLLDADYTLARERTVSLFNEYPHLSDSLSALAGNIKAHLFMFTVAGDANGRHNLPGTPMLDPVTGACFLLGLGIAIRSIRHWFSQILLLWLIASMLGGILSLDFEAPQGARTIGATAPIALLAALPLAAVARLIWLWIAAAPAVLSRSRASKTARPHSVSRYAGVVGVLIAAVVVCIPLGVALATNIDDYFNLHNHDASSWSARGGMQAITGRAAARLAGEGYVVRVSPSLAGDPALEWAAGQIPLAAYDPNVPVPFPVPARGLAVIIPTAEPAVIANVRQAYPEAPLIPLTPAYDKHAVVAEVVTISAADAERNAGLTVTFGSGSSPFSIEHVVGGAPWPLGSGSATAVSLKGTLVIGGDSVWTPLSFRALGLRHGTIVIDGTIWKDAVAGTEPILLGAGNHSLAIQGVGQAGPSVALEWARGNPLGNAASWTLVPGANLGSSRLPTGGLLGLYYAGAVIAGAPVLERVDATVNTYYQLPPTNTQFPFSARWRGSLLAASSGNYSFALDSTGPSVLYIDERPVITEPSGVSSPMVTVPLAAGRHRIRVDYNATGSYLHCYLTWMPPGQIARGPIPAQVLEPDHG